MLLLVAAVQGKNTSTKSDSHLAELAGAESAYITDSIQSRAVDVRIKCALNTYGSWLVVRVFMLPRYTVLDIQQTWHGCGSDIT